MRKQWIAGLASLMMVVPAVGNVQAKSSSAKLMDQFVAAYRKGNYQKAKAVSNKMAATVEEPCAYKMSKAMKKAYKATVQKYVKRYGDDWDNKNVNDQKTTRVDGYALSDVDGDGKAELFIATMDLYERPSTEYNVYTFKKGKAVRIGKNIEMLDGYLHAYPGKKGVYFFAQDHSVLALKKGIIKNGKFKWQDIKFSSREDSKNYYRFMYRLTLKMYLNGHFKNGHVDLSLFK